MEGPRKFVVQLSPGTRVRLEAITRNGSSSAKRIMHARVLLMSDRDHVAGRYTDAQIGRALGIHANTAARVRRKFVLQGEGPAVDRKVRLTPPVEPKLDGETEARLIALCCSKAPGGRVRWTLSLLQREMVGRGIVTSICRETIRKSLKKTGWPRGECNAFASPNATAPASLRRWSKCWTSTRNRPTTTSR